MAELWVEEHPVTLLKFLQPLWTVDMVKGFDSRGLYWSYISIATSHLSLDSRGPKITVQMTKMEISIKLQTIGTPGFFSTALS